jgi:hypothetical protein
VLGGVGGVFVMLLMFLLGGYHRLIGEASVEYQLNDDGHPVDFELPWTRARAEQSRAERHRGIAVVAGLSPPRVAAGGEEAQCVASEVDQSAAVWTTTDASADGRP